MKCARDVTAHLRIAQQSSFLRFTNSCDTRCLQNDNYAVLHYCLLGVYFPWRNSPPVGQCFLIIKASRSHSDTPLSVGLHSTSDQPFAETSTVLDDLCLYLTALMTDTPMPQAGFEHEVPSSERPQTHAIGRTAAEIGRRCVRSIKTEPVVETT
jgi:hypothetical protein